MRLYSYTCELNQNLWHDALFSSLCERKSVDLNIFTIYFQEEEIQTEIFINGPVQGTVEQMLLWFSVPYYSQTLMNFSATFEVSEDFFMYKSGVYKHTDLARNKGSKYRTTGSYHSVRVLGQVALFPSQFTLHWDKLPWKRGVLFL